MTTFQSFFLLLALLGTASVVRGADVCGDGVQGPTENLYWCAADFGGVCGDTTCSRDEWGAGVTPVCPECACVESEEEELGRLINEYRATLALPAISIGKHITTVARTHARDLARSPPNNPVVCNLHSWSARTFDGLSWSSCCYTSDHNQASCMWDKPRELTPLTGNGFEISATGYGSPAAALTGWQGSPGHNAVIANTGIWANMKWEFIGVGIDSDAKIYHVWFYGRTDDTPKEKDCAAVTPSTPSPSASTSSSPAAPSPSMTSSPSASTTMSASPSASSSPSTSVPASNIPTSSPSASASASNAEPPVPPATVTPSVSASASASASAMLGTATPSVSLSMSPMATSSPSSSSSPSPSASASISTTVVTGEPSPTPTPTPTPTPSSSSSVSASPSPSGGMVDTPAVNCNVDDGSFLRVSLMLRTFRPRQFQLVQVLWNGTVSTAADDPYDPIELPGIDVGLFPDRRSVVYLKFEACGTQRIILRHYRGDEARARRRARGVIRSTGSPTPGAASLQFERVIRRTFRGGRRATSRWADSFLRMEVWLGARSWSSDRFTEPSITFKFVASNADLPL